MKDMNNQTKQQECKHKDIVKKREIPPYCFDCGKRVEPKAEEKETWEDRFENDRDIQELFHGDMKSLYWSKNHLKQFIAKELSTQKEQMIQRMNKIDQYSKVSTASGKKELLAKSDVLKALREKDD